METDKINKADKIDKVFIEEQKKKRDKIVKEQQIIKK